MASSFLSFQHQSFPGGDSARIFQELPKATIIQVSRPDAGAISPMQLTYVIEFRYKEVNQIRDPVIDSTYKDIWMATANVRIMTNTMIYQDVFSCIPNDLIHTRVSLRQCMNFWRVKLGHTTTNLGIAPNKLESYQDGDVKGTDPMERLKSVKGHLVSFPLDFMCKEDLRPVFNESEYYALPQVFH